MIARLQFYTCFKNCFTCDDLLHLKLSVYGPNFLTKKKVKSKVFGDWDGKIKHIQDILFEQLLPNCDDSQIIKGEVILGYSEKDFFIVEIEKIETFIVDEINDSF